MAEVLHRADPRDSLDGLLNLAPILLNGRSLYLSLDLNGLLMLLLRFHSGWRSVSTVGLVDTVSKHAHGHRWHEWCGPLAAVANVFEVLDSCQLRQHASRR